MTFTTRAFAVKYLILLRNGMDIPKDFLLFPFFIVIKRNFLPICSLPFSNFLQVLLKQSIISSFFFTAVFILSVGIGYGH